MLIKISVLQIFVAGLFFMIILSIMAVASCRVLQRMPDNEKEKAKKKRSYWTEPEKFSYIVLAITWLGFVLSSVLMTTGDTFSFVIGIAAMIFILIILVTTSFLAFAVMTKKKKLNKMPTF